MSQWHYLTRNTRMNDVHGLDCTALHCIDLHWAALGGTASMNGRYDTAVSLFFPFLLLVFLFGPLS